VFTLCHSHILLPPGYWDASRHDCQGYEIYEIKVGICVAVVLMFLRFRKIKDAKKLGMAQIFSPTGRNVSLHLLQN
jgi:hypothetical protein